MVCAIRRNFFEHKKGSEGKKVREWMCTVKSFECEIKDLTLNLLLLATTVSDGEPHS